MTAGNNRRENTFKRQPEPETLEELPEIVEDSVEVKEETPQKEASKPRKETPKKADRPAKDKKPKAEKPRRQPKASDGNKTKRIVGILFVCLAVYLFIALLSYLFSFFGGHHQEFGYQVFRQSIELDNCTGRLGAFLSQTLIKESFGIGAFFFVYLLAIIGLCLTDNARFRMWRVWKYALMTLVWLPLLFAFIAASAKQCAIFGGAVGLWLNTLLTNYVGRVGVVIVLAFIFIGYAVFQFNLTFNQIKQLREKREEERRMEALTSIRFAR